ncbi:MAG TPA: YceI family protein [Anaerolineae bacterium]|nr:YceI family protein [Caldilineae bacterium]HID34959.1 YceI family protein [Anaerolineae bacterium]
MTRIRFPILFLPLLIALLAACGSPAPQAEPTLAPTQAPTLPPATEGQRTFVVDSDQSQAAYAVEERFLEKALPKLGIQPGVVTTVGVSKQVEGEIRVNPDDLAQTPVDAVIRVDLSALTSDQPRRDKWIKENGPSFLTYPIAEFRATAIRNVPASYTEGQEIAFQLAGDLTIRDITHPVVFDVRAKLANGVLTGQATAQIKMSDYGIEPLNFANTLTVADEVTLTVDLVARQK